MRVRLSAGFLKQLVATMFAVAFILLGVCIGSDDAKKVYAAELTEDASGKFKYAAYEGKETVKEFVGDQAPETVDGYVFAGWYADEKCTEAIKNDKQIDESTETIFYAKYIPESVLSTKVQVSSENLNEGGTDTRNMRFVSSVDELNYRAVGFALKYKENDSDTWEKFKTEGKIVFSRIKTNTTTDEYKFSPKVVDTKSEYFMTAIWKGAEGQGLTDFDTDYYVRAYWVTMDDVTVYGPVRYVSVNDGLNTNIINVAVKGAPTTTVGETVTVSGVESATGTVAYHDGTYSHVRIDLGEGVNKTAALKSVTKFTVDGKEVYYRNLYTKYVGTTASVDTSWYSVYGPNAGEYVIATSADLYGLPTLTNKGTYKFGNQTVYVIADIEVNKGTATPTGWNGEGGTAYSWTPIQEFYGTFDGQEHTIKGIQVQQSIAYCGFFGYTNSGQNVVIKNFRLENSYFGQSSKNGLGSIVGWGEGGTIQNVYSNAYVYKTGGEYSGGIVGFNYKSPMTIQNCCYAGVLTTDIGMAGGILGSSLGSTADITACSFTGEIISTANVHYFGGIVGVITANSGNLTITDCKSSGSIETVGWYSGGLVGMNNQSLILTGCESSGSIKTSGHQSGGLVGRNGSDSTMLTITDCKSSSSIETSGTQFGGIVGLNEKALTITDCLFDGEIIITGTATYRVIGGIVGKNTGATCNITTCLNSGIFTNNTGLDLTAVCRLVGQNENANMQLNKVYFTNEGFNGGVDYYSPTTPTNPQLRYSANEADISGKCAFFNTSLNFDENGKWALVAEGTPVLKTFATEVLALPEVPEDVNLDWYKGVEATTYNMCDDMDNDEANVKDLYGLAYLVKEGITFAGKTVSMGADVTVNEGTVEQWEADEFANLKPWIPIGDETTEFAGTLDGTNHKISGIYINSSEQGTGVFRSTAAGSTIQNLKLEESYIKSTSKYVGSIVGTCGGNITNVSSDAKIIGSDYYVGGLVGGVTSNNVSIDSSCFFGQLNSTSFYAGGILGAVDASGYTINITKCYSNGTVTGRGNGIGGILGYCTSSTINITNCLNAGKVITGDAGAGGLLGRNGSSAKTTISNCLNRGTIEGPKWIGSIVGWWQSGTVTATSVYGTKTSDATGTDTSASIDNIAVGNNKTLDNATMVELTDITVSNTVAADSIQTTLSGLFGEGTIWTIGTEEGSMPELQLN